ncbi:hypothetical protein [Ureibacillus sinduriensis]|uniref:Holin n=1 Tax=Ureibacillus sinduriensis BLB-1 = JCM 15800 TaxID=1384057 RepID=A0A0A3HX17_9BACL|nr:hypothetical protein [Ureibacillus sinduriensis]KGR74903.1 hypothetical protein CD33_14210 [Ureibacillus sinduriensis BLB-1 = JCM 15800]
MEPVSAVTTASQIATSQAVWSICAILLVVYVFWHSNKRETRLLDNLSELTKAQGDQANTMQEISNSLTSLEGRMDRMEKYTYKYGDDE